MKASRLLALGVIVLLAMVAAQVRADPPSAEDLVACCDIPAAGQMTSCSATGCVIIDGSPASINRCRGLVIGCAEGAFECSPDRTTGKKVCTCSQFASFCASQNTTD